MNKLKVAIIGSGNIGTDLMIKILRNGRHLEMAAMVGIDPASDGLARAQRMGVATTHEGIEGLTRLPEFADIDFVFGQIEYKKDHLIVHSHLDQPMESKVYVSPDDIVAGLGRIDKGEGMVLEAGQVMDATVLSGQDHALVGALPGLAGDRHREGFDIRHRGRQHIGERTEIGDVELAGTQGFDDAVVVSGDEGLDRHAQLALQGVEHLLAGLDHRLGIFGRDQADPQRLLGHDRANGSEGEQGEAGNTQKRAQRVHGNPGCCVELPEVRNVT